MSIQLERVDYVTRDSIMNLGAPTYSDSFWQVRRIMDRPRSKESNETILFQTQLFLSPYNIHYYREIYNLRTLATGLGGIFTVCKIMGFVLIYPLSKNLFYLNVMKQLYFL